MTLLTKYKIEEEQIKVYSHFSWAVVKEAKKLGGKFQDGAWVFPMERLEDIEEKLGQKGEIVKVKVSNDEIEDEGDSIKIGWYVLASRKSRDRQANINANLVKGEIPEGGGSMKHPSVDQSSDSEFTLYVYRDFAEKNNLRIMEERNKDDKEGKIADIKAMMEKYGISKEDL